MRHFLVIAMLMCHAMPVWASGRTVTLFLDGARIEQDFVPRDGYVEISLPASLLPNSLRMKPAGGNEISRVELVPAGPPVKVGKEWEKLAERRDRLQARLKALDVKEEIFRAAAKAQSGKAPRASKTNPEPLTTLRRGTEYALSQLEEVYRLKSQAEKDLKEVMARLGVMEKGKAAAGGVARVWVKKQEGGIRVSYLVSDRRWQPHYDFRLTGNGRVTVVQRAVDFREEKGAELFIANAGVGDPPVGTVARVTAGAYTVVADYSLPLEQEAAGVSLQPSLVFSFKNQSGQRLPPGEGACYSQGVYLGTVSFPGSQPGELRELRCGQ
jgi:hypothetical protein